MTRRVLCSIFGSMTQIQAKAPIWLKVQVQHTAGAESYAKQSVVSDQQFKHFPDKSLESNPGRRCGTWRGAEGKTPEETLVLFHATLASAAALRA